MISPSPLEKRFIDLLLAYSACAAYRVHSPSAMGQGGVHELHECQSSFEILTQKPSLIKDNSGSPSF